MVRNFWTESEDKILINAKINGYTYKKIHEELLPLRTLNSIRVRGSLLIKRGDLLSNKIRSNKTWSQEEEQYLITLRIKDMSYKEIATLLNRTESSIKNKISLISKPLKELNLKKKKIIEAINNYPSKNKYSGRYYYKYDIPSFKEIDDIFGSWDNAKKEANIILNNTSGILYYVKIIKDEKTYYKIGITSKTVEERFRSEKNIQIITLKEKHYKNIKQARDEESLILSTFINYKAQEQILNYGGNSEIFNKDILNLDA